MSTRGRVQACKAPGSLTGCFSIPHETSGYVVVYRCNKRHPIQCHADPGCHKFWRHCLDELLQLWQQCLSLGNEVRKPAIRINTLWGRKCFECRARGNQRLVQKQKVMTKSGGWWCRTWLDVVRHGIDALLGAMVRHWCCSPTPQE